MLGISLLPNLTDTSNASRIYGLIPLYKRDTKNGFLASAIQLFERDTCTTMTQPSAHPLENTPAAGVPYFTPAQSIPSGTAYDPQPKGQQIPSLFKPLKIRGVELQNRIFVRRSSRLDNPASHSDVF
jgi:hypothetical protein